MRASCNVYDVPNKYHKELIIMKNTNICPKYQSNEIIRMVKLVHMVLETIFQLGIQFSVQ